MADKTPLQSGDHEYNKENVVPGTYPITPTSGSKISKSHNRPPLKNEKVRRPLTELEVMEFEGEKIPQKRPCESQGNVVSIKRPKYE